MRHDRPAKASAPASVRLAMLDWLHELVTYTPQVIHTFLALKEIDRMRRREHARQCRRAEQSARNPAARPVARQLSRGLE